jgi:hypothetical protein
VLAPRSRKAPRFRANPGSLIQPQTHRRLLGVVRRRCCRPRLPWVAHAGDFARHAPRLTAGRQDLHSGGTPAAMRRSATRCRQSDVRSCRCTNSSYLGCRCSMRMAGGDQPSGSRKCKLTAAAHGKRSESTAAASSIQHAPSRYRPSICDASRYARRVLPTPGRFPPASTAWSFHAGARPRSTAARVPQNC